MEQITELLDKKILNFQVESMTVKEGAFEGEDSKNVIIEGKAMPFNQMSRNGVTYRKESVLAKMETMVGKPLLFNHNGEEMPIGKVLEFYEEKDGVYYKAELDGSETVIISKLKNGYLQNVSIQCMYENVVYNEDGTVELDVSEFLELSVVTIPGFGDTTANLVENLKMTKKKEEKTSQEQDDNGDGEEPTLADAMTKISELEAKNAEQEQRIGVLESRVDAMDEEETEEESEDESEDDESEEEKSDEDEEDESEESGDNEEDDKEKESLKRNSIPSATSGEKKKSIDCREMRLNRKGY